jgi:hypothetical protein
VPPAIWTAPQPIVQRTETSGDTGKPCRTAGLCLPPCLENCGFLRFCPWTRRLIVGFVLYRTGKKPLSLFLHDFTAWFSHDFRKVAPEAARDSALRFQFHFRLQ